MNHVSIYLERFKDIGVAPRKRLEAIIEAIKGCSGISVDAKKIKIKDNYIEIGVLGPEKAVIFMNQEKIKERIYQSLKIERKIL